MGSKLRIFVGLALALSLLAVPAEAARSTVVPFITEVTVVNTGNTPVVRGHLQVPLLSAASSPYQRVISETFDPAPLEIREDEHGNRQARFALPRLEPGSRLVFRVTYEVASIPFSLKSAPAVETPATGLAAWLEPEPGIESDHPAITGLAAAVTRGRQGQEAARAIFSAVTGRLTYDLAAADRQAGALTALESGQGVCGDFSRLFVALARAAGIPARLVNGYARADGALGPDRELGRRRHTWAEFYLEGTGWVPVDATYRGFADLAEGTHLAQNYRDEPLRGLYLGGELRVTMKDYIPDG